MDVRIEDQPGFRRRIVITPNSDRSTCEVEDDYHHMKVSLIHDGERATQVEALMIRVPWTTCPGARAVAEATFTDVRLDAFARRGEKKANCTHLHDLAIWVAAHALDAAPTCYDVFVSDPVDGLSAAELRRNGTALLRWNVTGFTIVDPPVLAGLPLTGINEWIATRDPAGQEAARILRWACLLAHGRQRARRKLSYEQADLPAGQCFTFQPERMATAARTFDTFVDFSETGTMPLSH
jgi:hypothetical protein